MSMTLRIGQKWLFKMTCRAAFRMGLTCSLIAAGCRPGPSSVPTSAATAEPRQYLGSQPSNANPAGADAPDWFFESTALPFVYRNGFEGKQFTILESVGGGAALVDLDLDGDVDLIVAGGGRISSGAPMVVTGLPLGVFLNDGPGSFTDSSHIVEMPNPVYSHGVVAADWDRDGDDDLLVTGYPACRLLRNDQGKKLVDVSAGAGLIEEWTTAATWGDINHDGWPDLLVVGYVDWNGQPDKSCGDTTKQVRDTCPPQNYGPTRQRLYLNNRDGTFQEIAQPFEGTAQGKGMGAVAADLNGDGWIDFYIANDQVANQLYLGQSTFPYPEIAVTSGTSGSEFGVAEGSMGVDAGDYNGDGRLDLFATNYELEDNSLYENQGQNFFRHSTVRAGLGGLGRPYVGFGTGFVDFDLDGWLDLFVINGHVLYETGRSAYLQPSLLFRNVPVRSSRGFLDVTALSGGRDFQSHHSGRGATVGDLDNDGDPDLVIVRQNEPVAVLLNRTQPRHWFSVELRGTSSDPHAVGATVSYEFNGRTLVRHVNSGGGYLSQFDRRILFPATESDTLEVTVRWLSGASERFRKLKPRATNLLEEGQGESS